MKAPTVITTKYMVNIRGELTVFDKFEDAARSWDAATFQGPAPEGGIQVQVWHDEVMVRDGWVLHVSKTGTVYINPLGA